MDNKKNRVMEALEKLKNVQNINLIDICIMSLIITFLPYLLFFMHISLALSLLSILVFCAVPLLYIKMIQKRKIDKIFIVSLIATVILNKLLYFLLFVVDSLFNIFTVIIIELIINAASMYVYFLVCNKITAKNKLRQEQISKLDNIEEIENSKEQLIPMIEPLIKPLLKSPISAVFCEPEELLIVYDIDNIYRIHGYVNSQNGYGAMIKTGFQVRAKYINNKWEIISSGMENQFVKGLASNYLIAIVITIILFAISSLIVNLML